MRLAYLLLISSLVACADAGDSGLDEIEVSDLDGKADTSSELRVRTGDTTVWMTKTLSVRETVNGPTLVLRGRASRNIVDGMGFVFDDPYGDFAIKSARTFEVTWPVSTARSLVDGVNQFVRLGFTPSSSRPDTLTARVVVRPRLGEFAGTSSIYLTAELTPVVYGGTVVYRVRGKTTSANFAVTASAGDLALTDVRRLDDTRFEIDLAPDVALASPVVTVSARLGTGATVTKNARVGFAIKRLGLTSEDPTGKWPHPTCTETTSSCLLALADGSLDLASCGEAIVVQACAGQVGVFADDVAVQAAIADGAARTGSAAFQADATGLVGSARAAQLAFGAQQTIEDRVQQLFGRWYLSAATRDAVLDGAVDRGLVDAYARPLDYVEPTTPVPGNATAVRNVAADALLVALTEYNFIGSEYARSYDELIAQFRAQHVASIRAFRETIAIEPHSNPAWDVLIGNWLDPYVEISIDRATGTAAGVYIEID